MSERKVPADTEVVNNRIRFPTLQGAGREIPTAVAAAWVILIALSGIHRADFFSQQTVLAIAFTMAVVGVLTVAQALIGISGGILDLSQPTGLAIAAASTAALLNLGCPIAVAILIAILLSAAWGLLNGVIVVYCKLNPVIVTLATNFIGLGILFLIFQTIQAPLHSTFSDFGRSSFLGLPRVWWPMVMIVSLVGFVLPRIRLGRNVIAVGGNRQAAQAVGISVSKIRLITFTVSGAIVGVGGVLFAASSGPFSPDAGMTFQLPVIASVILAGVSLSGGRGRVSLVLLSVGFLSTVPTAMVFFGFSTNWQTLLQGMILIGAVAADGWQTTGSQN
ncbi:ABC transporter permease [Mesorhizobium opportunistum]|uniref:ABC transporter permease n=1 Tax=Mesorhizobium opportunistum TaxID=593909 RepID=UPI003336B2AD